MYMYIPTIMTICPGPRPTGRVIELVQIGKLTPICFRPAS